MYDSKLTRVAFACGLGGLIGAVLALEIANRSDYGKALAFAGLFAGGCIGWLAYDFREVGRAFIRAATDVYGRCPTIQRLAYTVRIAPFAAVVGYTCGILLSLVLAFSLGSTEQPLNLVTDVAWHITITGFVGTILTGLLIEAMTTREVKSGNVWEEVVEQNITATKRWAWNFNPIGVIVWLAIFAPVAAFYVGCGIYLAVVGIVRASIATPVIIGQVLWLTFRYVHSDLRALCFVDGTIGAAIGFYANEPLIGLVAGFVFGVINYLIVSRWLMGLHRG